MKRMLNLLVLVAVTAFVAGCHTYDVCDDCGDCYEPHVGANHPGNCTSCGSHAVVKPYTGKNMALVPVNSTDNIAAKQTTTNRK